jgi:cytochrome c
MQMQYSGSPIVICTLVTSLLVSISPRTFAAESSQVAFNNRCRTCHSIKASDNRMGPTLHGVIGRKAGSLSEFVGFSQALKSSGIVWDADTLNKFIENPDSLVPGNNMKPYPGITDEGERTQIVDYLASLSAE